MLIARAGVTVLVVSIVQHVWRGRGKYELARFDAAWCCGETSICGGETGRHL